MYFGLPIPNLKSEFQNSPSFWTYLRFCLVLLCKWSHFCFSRNLTLIIFRAEASSEYLSPRGICCSVSRYGLINFAGKFYPTEIWKNSFLRISSAFFRFSWLLRQFASQTLIVWGGCRFRPILQYRNLTCIESMAVHNCVKALSLTEYAITYGYFRQNPLYSTSLERADSQLSFDTSLVFLSQFV